MSEKRLTLSEIWDYRSLERKAFSWCVLALSVGYLAFFLSGGPERRGDWINLIPLGIFAGSLLLIHSVFLLGRIQSDPGLTIPIAFLSGLGLLAQFRMGLFDFENPWRLSHFAYPMGIFVMLIIALFFKRDRFVSLRFFRWLCGFGALAIVGALLATGSRFRGAFYASGNMTPTEFIKVFVVIFLAGQLAAIGSGQSKRKSTSPSEWAIITPIILFFGLLFPLLLWQRDLGMVAILGGLAVVMVFVATGRWLYVIGALMLGVSGGFAAFTYFLHSQKRFQVWLDPFVDPTGASWQLLQGLSGMYSGGLWGAGFGEGNPERIPIAASDFIYAVIGEELGYVGCMLVILLFLGFFRRAYRVAGATPNQFGSLLVVGFTTVIALQTFLNIGGVTKALPLTGIPLPFISHGGSSLVTMFVCLGLIIAIADSAQPQIVRIAPKRKSKKRSQS